MYLPFAHADVHGEEAPELSAVVLQGHLAHKEPPSPGPPTEGPTVALGECGEGDVGNVYRYRSRLHVPSSELSTQFTKPRHSASPQLHTIRP